MKIALQVFGQFRCAREWLDKNLCELDKELSHYDVDVYILTDKNVGSNYSQELEEYVRKTFNKHNYRIVLFKFWEELEQYHDEELKRQEEYNKYVLQRVKELERGHDKFVARMWYRKYILNKIFAEIKDIKYDCVMTPRLFDTELRILRPFDFIHHLDDDSIYFNVDIFFMGTEKAIEKMFNIGNILSLSDDSIWQDEEFKRKFIDSDINLGTHKPTYCSEIQMFYYAYKTFTNAVSIRYDFTNPDEHCKNNSEAYIWNMIKR